jgi:hypothetical protein
MAIGATREASVSLRLKNAQFRRELKQSQQALRKFGKEAQTSLRSGFQMAVGGFAGVVSAQGLIDVGRGALETEKVLTRIGIQAGDTGQLLNELRSRSTRLRDTFGIQKSETAAAAKALVDLQGVAGASAVKVEAIAKASKATGDSMEALAGVTFAMQSAFKGIGDSQAEKALSAVIEAGKQGSVPMGEMAVVLQQTAAAFSKVSEAGVGGAADLAAAIQIGRRGFGSAAETGTGLQSFLSALSTNADKFKKVGRIQLFEKGPGGVTRLKDFRTVLDLIGNSKLAKDDRLLVKAFGSSEAVKFFRALHDGRAEFEAIATAARESNAVTVDAQKFLQSEAGRTELAFARLRGKVENVFTPDRIDKMVTLAETLGEALGFVVDNAEVFLLLWGGTQAFKALGSLKEMGAAMTALGGAAGGLGKSAGGLRALTGGALGLAGALGQALTVGLSLGTALDQTLGLSEKISDYLANKSGTDHTGTASKFDPTGEQSSKVKFAAQIESDIGKSQRALEHLQSGALRIALMSEKGSQRGRSLIDKATAGTLSMEEQRELESFLQEQGELTADESFITGKDVTGAKATAEKLREEAAGTMQEAQVDALVQDIQSGHTDLAQLDIRSMQRGGSLPGVEAGQEGFLDMVQFANMLAAKLSEAQQRPIQVKIGNRVLLEAVQESPEQLRGR